MKKKKESSGRWREKEKINKEGEKLEERVRKKGKKIGRKGKKKGRERGKLRKKEKRKLKEVGGEGEREKKWAKERKKERQGGKKMSLASFLYLFTRGCSAKSILTSCLLGILMKTLTPCLEGGVLDLGRMTIQHLQCL
jgi:hypothetical protein